MKICWFNEDRLGVVSDGRVHDVSAALEALAAARYPGPPGDFAMANWGALRAGIERLLPSAPTHALAQVRLGSPVARPGKIIGVPVNYGKHVQEAAADVATFTARHTGSIREQGLFLKATSSLIGCNAPIRVRFPERVTHHEIELGVIIGRTADRVSQAEALSCIAGYTIALDMTVRGPEDRSLRKSVDSYSVLGPWMVTADEIEDPQHLSLRLTVNGQCRQSANTAEMLMPIAEQIAWASSFYTLHPGDVIMTGTCEGVGPVVPGDVIRAEIEGIGAIDVQVACA